MKFPEHALHQKDFLIQRGVDTLVNSRERRAAVVPRIT